MHESMIVISTVSIAGHIKRVKPSQNCTCFIFCKLHAVVPVCKQQKGEIIKTTCNTLFWPRREKTCLPGFANNKDADQAAHPRSLISAFVISFLESIIFKLASSEISIF